MSALFSLLSDLPRCDVGMKESPFLRRLIWGEVSSRDSDRLTIDLSWLGAPFGLPFRPNLNVSASDLPCACRCLGSSGSYPKSCQRERGVRVVC